MRGGVRGGAGRTGWLECREGPAYTDGVSARPAPAPDQPAQPVADVRPARAARTPRFNRRRAQILDTASALINRHGLRGMTLTAVARALALDTSSVTYYFRRKEQLAAACFERTLRFALEAAEAAACAPDPPARVRHLIATYFDLYRAREAPGAGELAVLSDIRALDEAARAPLEAIYAQGFAAVRGMFAPGEGHSGGSRSAIAATHLTASLQWLPAWIDRYQPRDFARVEARLFDVLAHGLASDGRTWPLPPLPPLPAREPGACPAAPAGEAETAQARFLAAATRLINRYGYAGASVERIAAELGVSTGSFYHHLDNKDDLVLACFRRSFATIEWAQAHGDAAGRDQGERLAIAAAMLVAMQFDENSPLLRMSAYQALPLELRADMLQLAAQLTRHVAGTIADGIADGSLRAVDPLVAGQTVMAAISAASDLRRWAAPRDRAEAVAAYLAPLRTGLFG
ncbi:transcriptional regulator, TetR family [Sphingomonas sp. OV641]|uniref:TetR/AcrR family transcriptional regulator n=1 Tax=Sphingomonas sp. OV641 TaxID=1881068 RepID=UPI0008B0AEFC|nr:TetR family transcriptional regulator [Sphingomonas sp. OV641]SEJ88323.1 transcriptional regulator, TetR family [Sphingomonas sp. OV641]